MTVVRQIFCALSQFEKTNLVAKLKHARDRERTQTGRCEKHEPVPTEVVREDRRLARQNSVTHKKGSLREIVAELAAHSADGERRIRSVMNTGSGDHEHLLVAG